MASKCFDTVSREYTKIKIIKLESKKKMNLCTAIGEVDILAKT